MHYNILVHLLTLSATSVSLISSMDYSILFIRSIISFICEFVSLITLSCSTSRFISSFGSIMINSSNLSLWISIADLQFLILPNCYADW